MKFSVIVPVYGVEKYLEECVTSITSQTFDDFEIILVDDKSPDNCPAMCDGLAQKDPRIRVIHKEQNEGLGFARNTGMAAAKGDYIMFVDSDDTIALDTLQRCNEELSDGIDILVYGMKLCYENKQGITKWSEAIMPERTFYADTLSLKSDIFALLTRSRVFNYVCNKVYRRSFLTETNVFFEKTKLIEDFLFNIEIFKKAQKIKCLNQYFYLYRKPAHQTLANTPNSDFFELCKRKYCLEKDFLELCNGKEKYLQLINMGYVKHIISVIIRNKSKNAELGFAQQKQAVSKIINDPLTVDVMSEYVPHSLPYKLVSRFIKNKKPIALLLVCSLINFMQYKLKPALKKFLNSRKR